MNYTRLTHDTFYLTDEQLENSPSRKDGIDKDTEAELRSYGCTLVQEAGILLAFPQAVMATGQVLLHRFYCKRSMKHFNVKKVAATALWHGAKLEEVPEVSGHPRELLNKVMVAIDRCIARRETQEGRKLSVLDLHSKEAEEFRRSLIRYELEMLKAFGFITHVEHPHKLLLNYCQIMGLDQSHIGIASEGQEEGRPEFCQAAWDVANDSLRTTLCVRHKGSVVACGIIFYTARKLKVPLPESPPWWTLFSVSLPQVCEVAATLHQLYKTPKPRFIPVCHQLLPSKPPTPAGAAALADGAAADTGATPLPGRPGGKPLDPSVRRTLGDLSTRVVGATPKQGETAPAAGPGSGTPAEAAAVASAPPSPQRSDAPGSARKRSRSPQGDEARKRHQQDSSQPPAAAGGSQNQQQQQPPPSRPDSAGGDRPASGLRRGANESDRDRDRDRERSSKPSSRHRSHSRDRDRDRDRGRRRSSRSRSRDRGHGGSRGGRGDSRNDRGRSDRERERERDRRHRDSSRERGDRHRQQHRDRDREQDRDRRDGRDREGRRAEGGKDKQQQQQPVDKDDKGSAAAAATTAADGGSTNDGRKGTEQQLPSVAGSKGGFPPPPGSSSVFPPPRADVASGNGVAANTGKNEGTGSTVQGSRAALAPPRQPPSAAAVRSPDSSRPAQPGDADAATKPPAAKPKPVAVRKKPPAAPGSTDGSGHQGAPKQGTARVAVPSTEEAAEMEL